MAGCTISPLVFTLVMEVIIRASKWVVGGQRLGSSLRLPPLRAYMHDITTLTTTVPCTRRLLGKLEENITWAHMKIRPSKSRSISVVKGVLSDLRSFIGGDPIPMVFKQPVKSLWCKLEGQRPSETAVQRHQQRPTVHRQHPTAWEVKDLVPAVWASTPGVVAPCSLWGPHLDSGVPQCLTTIGLYGDGVLKLPLISLSEDFKCAKTRLLMTVNQSKDLVLRNNTPTLATRHKWRPAKAALRHADIVGHVQQGRVGLGLTTSHPAWSKATPKSWRKMVVEEVCHQEEAVRGQGNLPWQTWTVDTVRQHREEEDQLEGCVGNGSKAPELYYQSYLWRPANTSQSPSVVWWGFRVCPLSHASLPPEHTHRV